jgi:hypothetical protein
MAGNGIPLFYAREVLCFRLEFRLNRLTFLKKNGRFLFRDNKNPSAPADKTLKGISMDKKDFDKLKKICKDLRRRVGRLEQMIIRKNNIHPIKMSFEEDEDLIDVVQKVICEVWDVTLEQLLSKRRGRHLVNARISAAHLAYKDYGLGNTTEIGNRFGRRHHSTISSEVQSADDLLENKDIAFCEPHNRAKATLDIRFQSIKNNGRPINFQI